MNGDPAQAAPSAQINNDVATLANIPVFICFMFLLRWWLWTVFSVVCVHDSKCLCSAYYPMGHSTSGELTAGSPAYGACPAAGSSMIERNAAISSAVTPQSSRYSSMRLFQLSPSSPYFAKPSLKCDSLHQ